MIRRALRTVAGILLVLGFCAGADRLGADPYTVSVCGFPGGPDWDSWFSLPNQSSIGTAEDLCRAFGTDAASVSQLYPQQASTATPREYTYDCGTGVCTVVGTSIPPSEPGCATSACFCVDDGEGFGVVLNTANATFTADGCYTAFSAPLAAASGYLTSIAPDAPLVTFDDLALAVGLTRTGIVRGVITRLNCTTGVPVSANAGTAAAQATNLVPGEAYRLRNPTALIYTNPTSGGACVCTETALYDITGVGDGTAYAWWLDSFKDGVYAAGEFFAASVPGEPVANPSGDLANNLVNSINAVIGGSPCTASLASYSPARISITCTPCSFDLYVAPGTTGNPPFAGQCAVVTTPCTYNPTIRRVFAADDAGDVEDTLMVAPGAGGDIDLSWGASCVATDTDFEVYEGTIGSWYSHFSRLCSTGGTPAATLTPQPADSYYLVVPRNRLYEGLYGRDSRGTSRPQGGGACAVQQVTPSCP